MVAGRRIRFTAVLVGVVLALTGFSSHGGSSSSGSSGKSKSKSSSGGGCSSSKSKKKSHGSGGDNGKATASPSASASGAPATAVVVTCVAGTPPVTTVRITSNVDRKAAFTVQLYREGAGGATIESTEVEATLEARGTRTVEVALKEPSRAAEVTTCRLDRPREASGTSTRGPAGTTTSGGSGPTPGTTPGTTPRSTPTKSSPKSTRKP